MIVELMGPQQVEWKHHPLTGTHYQDKLWGLSRGTRQGRGPGKASIPKAKSQSWGAFSLAVMDVHICLPGPGVFCHPGPPHHGLSL